MEIAFQLIIIFICFQKIILSFPELTKTNSLTVYGGNNFYIDLTKLGDNIGFIYLDIMYELPKGYILTKYSLPLKIEESNNIAFNLDNFKEISSYSHETKTVYGRYISSQDWFKFKIELKSNTKYLLVKTLKSMDDEGKTLIPTHSIHLTSYEKKTESNSDSNNGQDDKKLDIYYVIMIFFGICVIILIILEILIHYKKNKSKKSEINTPLNVNADQILPVEFSNQKKENQTNDNEIPKSNNEISEKPLNEFQNNDIQVPDYHGQNPGFEEPTPSTQYY